MGCWPSRVRPQGLILPPLDASISRPRAYFLNLAWPDFPSAVLIVRVIVAPGGSDSSRCLERVLALGLKRHRFPSKGSIEFKQTAYALDRDSRKAALARFLKRVSRGAPEERRLAA